MVPLKVRPCPVLTTPGTGSFSSYPGSLLVLQPERSLAGGEGSVSPLGLSIPLLFDILLQHTERCSSTTQHAIGATPEHGLTIPPCQFCAMIAEIGRAS